MSSCGCGHNRVFDGMDQKFIRALWIVIAINGGMFLVEMFGGALAGSQALLADALDFLGDSLTYGISLWAIGKPLNVRSNAAIFKGISLLAMGAWVLLSTLYQFFILKVPVAPVMGGIAIMALLANVASILFLMKYKDGDANVRSVWLCSRNDALSNVLVFVAALFVFWTNSALPDLIVAIVMAYLFTSSALQILKQAREEKKSLLADIHSFTHIDNFESDNHVHTEDQCCSIDEHHHHYEHEHHICNHAYAKNEEDAKTK